MTVKENIINLFTKLEGDFIDIDGLKLFLSDVSINENIKKNKDYTLYFNIENPKDIPYFTPILEEELYDIVVSFGKYINKTLDAEIDYRSTKGLYLNETAKKEVQKVFDDLPYIPFKLYLGANEFPDEYRIYGKSNGMSYSWDSEAYWIVNKFIPTKATLNGELIDIEGAINAYQVFLENKETYWESENLYRQIDKVITKYPLISVDYVATYYDTKFYLK